MLERGGFSPNAAINFALMYVDYLLLPHDFNHAAMSAAHLKERASFLRTREETP
jgi:hypothetical protein